MNFYWYDGTAFRFWHYLYELDSFCGTLSFVNTIHAISVNLLEYI